MVLLELIFLIEIDALQIDVDAEPNFEIDVTKCSIVMCSHLNAVKL